MQCPNCQEEMEFIGVNERMEDKYHCNKCYCQKEGERITKQGIQQDKK